MIFTRDFFTREKPLPNRLGNSGIILYVSDSGKLTEG